MSSPDKSNEQSVGLRMKAQFSAEEDARFREGLRLHGRDFAAVALHVGSRTEESVRTRARVGLHGSVSRCSAAPRRRAQRSTAKKKKKKRLFL